MVGGFDNRARAETGVLNRPRILLVSLRWRNVCIGTAPRGVWPLLVALTADTMHEENEELHP